MTWSVASSYEYCRRLARARARNFYYAFLILPGPQRRAMCALYAFMRIADDLADEPAPVEQKRRALLAWQRGLDQALAGSGHGRYRHPIHPALCETIRRYDIPVAYLTELLQGVRTDLTCQRYDTFEELYRYCYRVASVVGLACIRIWGCRDCRADQFAEWSGIAFQLTNILRDVREDAKSGRVYLPQTDLARFGCAEGQLVQGPWDQTYRALMRFEMERARSYYERARPLINFLPPAGKAVFQIMTCTYRGLLDALERRGFAQESAPVRLSRWHKWGLVLQAVPVRLGWV